MSNAETELLRESIDRLTQDERVPAGLADHAFRRDRQRRIALRTVAATGTAALAAAGAFAAVTAGPGAAPRIAPGAAPGKGHPAPPRLSALTTAYVSGRAERALATAQRANLIEQIHTVAHNYPLGLAQVLVFHPHGQTGWVIQQSGATAVREDSWYYRGHLREEGFNAAGRPLYDASSATTRSPAGRPQPTMTVSGTGINYTSKTWWRAAEQIGIPPTPTQPPCRSAYLPPPVGTPVNWPAEIRAGLSCGHYRLAGHEWIGSVRAIKLVSQKLDGPYSESLLVDPVSYLPMQMTYHWLDHRGTGPGTLTSTFRWGQPTPANLGSLGVKVPAGFRHTHTGGLPVPGINL
jgi:hypothetical protein